MHHEGTPMGAPEEGVLAAADAPPKEKPPLPARQSPQ